MTETTAIRYPLLPLRDMVIYPGSVTSIFVGREKSMEATRRAMDADRKIILATQRNAEITIPGLSDLYETGVAAEILQLLKMPDNTYKILIEGLSRVRIVEIDANDEKCQIGVAVPVPSVQPTGEKEIHLYEKSISKLVDAFERLNEQQTFMPTDNWRELKAKDDAERMVHAIAESLRVPFVEQQDILGTDNLWERRKSQSGDGKPARTVSARGADTRQGACAARQDAAPVLSARTDQGDSGRNGRDRTR